MKVLKISLVIFITGLIVPSFSFALTESAPAAVPDQVMVMRQGSDPSSNPVKIKRAGKRKKISTEGTTGQTL
jgi:hypothetical protein